MSCFTKDKAFATEKPEFTRLANEDFERANNAVFWEKGYFATALLSFED